MKYYPVIVPTLNRYEHFRRLVESLAQNTHADKTELVIGLDYPPSVKYQEGYERIKAYLPEISGFKSVTVLAAEQNLGPIRNTEQLREYVRRQGYDGYIFSEDDNEFSPCFLDYMDQGLERYKHEEKVLFICGYTPFDHQSEASTFFAKHMSAWGCGIWFEKLDKIQSNKNIAFLTDVLNDVSLSMRLFKWKPTSINFLLWQVSLHTIYGDAYNELYCFLNNAYCLFPTMSLVRNWGNDGTGVHCKNRNNDWFVETKISDSEKFCLSEIPISESSEIRSSLKKTYTKRWYGNCAIFIRYVLWRFFHKDIFLALKKGMKI